MPKRIAVSTLNASTLDIMNVIRQNASYEYQSMVPKITRAEDVPKVGAIIYGTPALSNAFLNQLVNRIALVAVQSATFNNPYERLKKGYLEFGETIEDIFVSIANVVEYDPEKGEEREFKRTIPDVKSVFHVINWRVMYPITIQDEDLKQAFYSMEGVQNLIAKLVDSIYTAAQYDEFLLFKYLIIKALSHGNIKPIIVGSSTAPLSQSAVSFRGISNLMTFMSNKYNEAGVKNTTPKNRQVIFMDSMFNAQYDVEVLAGAFNMDKADFIGSLFLIDDFTTFDNDRFSTIRANSTGVEEVTQEELALLKNVQAVMFDEEWFQVYDNNNKFTEKYVASGIYWNYFYHVWKTVSRSPFSNAVSFITSSATSTLPTSFDAHISNKDIAENATVLGIESDDDEITLNDLSSTLIQTKDLTQKGIGVQPYGAVLIPPEQTATNIKLNAKIGDQLYEATTNINAASTVDTKITFNKSTSTASFASID